MVDCYDIVFTVSAVKSMRIVLVGCCDSEAVCVESIVTRNAAIRVHLASLFFFIRDTLRSSGLPRVVIWPWQSF